MANSRKLSKSRYMAGLRCIKYLWLGIHKPELQAPPDEGTTRIMEMGSLVGKYAMECFKGGVLVNEDHQHIAEAILSTEKAFASGAPAIFEATVEAGSVLCRADILARTTRMANEWDIYEVKAATSVKDPYLHDVSFQRYCFESAGLSIRRTFLMHINNRYVRHGNIVPEILLIADDVTSDVIEAMNGVEDRIEHMVRTINQDACPNVKPGDQCSNPFMCPYFALCNKREPYDIHELPYGNKLIPELEAMGVRYLRDVPDHMPLSSRQRKTVLCARSGDAVIDPQGIREFTDGLKYPLHFFDFETISYAVPFFDNSRPYENIPFQFSLHIQREKNGPLTHHAFLHDQKSDPREPLINAMLGLLGKDGDIVAYNMIFEKNVIDDLIADFPRYSERLASLLPRFKDLISPFRRAHYVHRDFHGSASLKSVLPVLVPTLSYGILEIQEGGSASMAYEKWITGKTPEDEWQKTHQSLLKYCELDTLAMVEILKALDRFCVR